MGIKNHVYVMGVLPVYKGPRPFYVQQFVSYGMDPWNSSYLGSGTNASVMHNSTLATAPRPNPLPPGLPSLFLPDQTLCTFKLCPGSSFLMGAAVDQDNPPPLVERAAWRITDNGAAGTVTVSFSPTFTGHTYKIDTKSDLNGPWVIDNTYIAGTGAEISRTYTKSGTQKFFRVITDGLHPDDYGTLIPQLQ